MREFFDSTAGKLVAAGLILIGGYFLYSQIRNATGSPADALLNQPYIDSTTMQPFNHKLQIGETIPVLAPSGGNTGYPAEECFWNKDGTAKSTPTYVLLNKYLGKPGPTFCPDCGRLVVERNPLPGPGVKPPPTQQEYLASHDSRE